MNRTLTHLCLMYCVEWNTLKAKPARKSRGDSKPATGLKLNPVQSFKKFDISSNWGTLSSLFENMFLNPKNEFDDIKLFTYNHNFQLTKEKHCWILHMRVLGKF